MTAFDVVLLAVAGLLILRAFLRGFTGEIFSIASLTLGIFAALFFFKNGAAFLRILFLPGVPLVPEILSFLVIFLAVFITGKILEHVVKDIVNRLGLNGLDRFLGLILGLAEGIVVIALVLVFISIQPLFTSAALLEGSVLARLVIPLIGIARGYV
jgi:membrane protein required for colicin V production